MKLKNLAFTAIALTVALGTANAEDVTSTASRMPAVAGPSSTNPAAPVPGRNSFTEAQAHERLAKAGYSNISSLTKGEDGVWRATAKKAKMTHEVSLDYQGNITVTK